MSTRTVTISLLEQVPQIRILRFTPDLSSVDGDVLIQKQYKVVTDAAGEATFTLPVKASGSIRYEYEIPRDGGKSTGEFYLASGAPISLDELLTLGAPATDSIIDTIHEILDDFTIVGETPVGSVNGINATFTTANTFVPESVELFLNGLFQKKPLDFNTSGDDTLILVVSPGAGEILQVNYLRP